METRRLILAVILVIAVVLLYNRFFVPGPKPRPKESLEAPAREATSATSKPGDVVLIKGSNGHKLWTLLE